MDKYLNLNFFAYMNYNLAEKGYFNSQSIPLEEVLELLEKYIKNQIYIDQDIKDPLMLFEIYAANLKEDRSKKLSEIIFVFLHLLSSLQNQYIMWECTLDQEPTFSYCQDNPERINYLKSLAIPDYNKVFALILNKIMEVKERLIDDTPSR